MKLAFNPNLDYQKDAINAVCDLFDGQALEQNIFTVNDSKIAMDDINNVFSNKLNISVDDILENLKKVQKRNNITQSETLDELTFNIEMETGTGKTYVYLRTILELNALYGFSKFIIIVPNVAIKQGVNKTIEITKEHFRGIYSGTPIEHFIYDGGKVENIQAFANSSNIQIMIINIDSFNKEVSDAEKGKKTSNNIFKSYDKLNGETPIDLISSTNPFIIIDEPQSTVNTENAKKAIAKLSPICTLKYSATHRSIENLVYKLDAVDAYNKKLVKQIEVLGMDISGSDNKPYIKLISVDNSKSPITAKIEIYCHSDKGASLKTKPVKAGDDLSSKKFANSPLYEGYHIDNINCHKGSEYIEINDNYIYLNEAIGDNDEYIQKHQIKNTIKSHLDKELDLLEKGRDIKVLSLFFIDKVANFQTLDENNTRKKGKYAEIFEKEYLALLENPKYEPIKLDTDSIGDIYGGYFSVDKKSLKDTKGSAQADDTTYNLIMKNKEKLLSKDTKLRFIFSHTALREGWDNPNVFQICTLNDTKSEIKKRQEIGRGLRLCVNQNGQRVYDDSINKLTVITNESYENFVSNLQKEYEEDGIKFNVKNTIKDAKTKQKLKLNETVYASDDFTKLWDKINYKTTYSVKLKTDDLIKKCVESLNEIQVSEPKIISNKTSISMDYEKGIFANSTEWSGSETISYDIELPDIISYLVERTNLKRKTIVDILIKSETLESFKQNPQEYMRECSRIINEKMRASIIDGIKYTKLDDKYYEMELFKTQELYTYLNESQSNLNESQSNYMKSQKSIYNYIICDSKNEIEFAGNFENTENIKLYVKLPSWFKIKTPLGSYNPDWAILLKKSNETKLYFVLETKGSVSEEKLRPTEFAKIKCGKAHFKAIDTNVEFEAVDDFKKFINKL